MGDFKELQNMEVVDPEDFAGLYRTVLIDTPVGPYFLRFLEDRMPEQGDNVSMQEIQSALSEIQPEYIRI